VRPLAGNRPGARRLAAALLGLGGDALARGARVVTGRGGASAPPRVEPPAAEPSGASDGAARAAAAEEAAARLDAARERLRARIAPPSDEDLTADSPPPDDSSPRPPGDGSAPPPGSDASMQPPERS
jgi:hypothetical protein